jgi:hypothetical protein
MAGTRPISWMSPPPVIFFFLGGGAKFGCFFGTEKWDRIFHEKKGPKFATHIFMQKKKNPNLHILYNRFPICSQFYRSNLIFIFYVWFIAKFWLNCNTVLAGGHSVLSTGPFKFWKFLFGIFSGKKNGGVRLPTVPDFRPPPLGLPAL